MSPFVTTLTTHCSLPLFLGERGSSLYLLGQPKLRRHFSTAENIPVQYGGLERQEDEEFNEENGTPSEMFIRAGSMSSIEIPTPQVGLTVIWDIMVVGGEVSYREEFIPEDEGSYKILIRKDKKLAECIRNSYISEPGKLLVTLDNRAYKRKRLFYRSKTKQTVPVYNVSDQ